jgi:ATP synthase protein I
MSENDPRLKNIRDKLSQIKEKDNKANTSQKSRADDSESMSVGLRAGTELIASIAAGGFIGYWLDIWLETKPIFLIAMLILGVITGFVNVWRTTQNIGHAVGYKNLNNKDNNTIDKDDGRSA